MNPFERIFRALNKAHVKYMVVGGVAVNLYGFMRFTGDIDLVVLLNEANLAKIECVMHRLGYSERLPISLMDLGNKKQVRTWIREKNLKAFTFTPPYQDKDFLQLDIVIEESLHFEKIALDKTEKRLGSIKIPVISIFDLIKMKKKAHRARDLEDLKVLLDLKGL